jgi:2',3'-cyclic-nucleotide 2'-phosphodiesterase (5'-nucleotidase family)
MTDSAVSTKVSTDKGAHVTTVAQGAKATANAPAEPTVASLRIINVTDTYKLENFPSLTTLISEKTSEAAKNGFTTKSIMTGDFLAPYLLSAYDEGEGMMKMLNACPIDILTWGNHDLNDLSEAAVIKRESEYTAGVWINSNMTEHPTFKDSKTQCKYHIVDCNSVDGTNNRRVGFIGIITNDPKLYKRCNRDFEKWKIQDCWECMKEMKEELEGPTHKCDLVVPLCHLYEREDNKTCSMFDFPVVISGHDHHTVDDVRDGTRLLKAGADCEKAIVMDISWRTKDDKEAYIVAEHVQVSGYAKDPEILKLEADCLEVLAPLINTQLAEVPACFEPLSSKGGRGFEGGLSMAMARNRGQSTCMQYILTLVREGMNCDNNDDNDVDCAMLKGGNVRSNQEWKAGTKFTMDILLGAVSQKHDIHIYQIPGNTLQKAFTKSYDQPNNGWMHMDDGCVMDENGILTHVGRDANGKLKPIDLEKLYNIASLDDFPWAANGAVIGDYLAANPEHKGPDDAELPITFIIIQYVVLKIWVALWGIFDKNGDGTLAKAELAKFDTDGDGHLSKKELLAVIKTDLKYDMDESQDTLVDSIFAKVGLGGNDDGKISSKKLDELYCKYRSGK